ncbi:hypothetical protein FACS189434_13240 [Bacteroidia bacterium]|nr:hypothetical protein FACS189434_13240 [Bacteroidia bacterium]
MLGQIPTGLSPEFTCGMDSCSNCVNNTYQAAAAPSTCPSGGNGRSYASLFMPTANQPVIYIRANFIFLQRANGSGNFQENNAEHQAVLNNVITALNTTYSSLIRTYNDTCYTGNDFIADTRIQFVVNKLYVRDNYGWNNRHDKKSQKMCPDYPDWYLNYLDNQINSNPNIPRGINVYFSEDSVNYRNLVDLQNTQVYTPSNQGVACSQFPETSNYIRTSKLHYPDMYSRYWYEKNIVNNNLQDWINGWGRGLAHELGHSLYLFHECPHYPNPLIRCRFTIMNPGGGKPRNYLPPSEIGVMHAAFSLTNLRSFISEDTYLGTKTINNAQGKWANMRLYNSLIIASNSDLEFPCEMTMPYQANIEIYGKLKVDGSNIHSIKGDWKGIVVKSGGILELNTTNISDYDITVESGGFLIIRGNLTISGNHNITVKAGASICIENTATINLVDYNSIISVKANAIIGTNSSIQVNCISPWNISTTGNGKIINGNLDVYIQNETITSNRYVGGRYIYVGKNVTSSKSQGDVLINNNANVIFEASESVYLDAGVDVQSGSGLEIK